TSLGDTGLAARRSHPSGRVPLSRACLRACPLHAASQGLLRGGCVRSREPTHASARRRLFAAELRASGPRRARRRAPLHLVAPAGSGRRGSGVWGFLARSPSLGIGAGCVAPAEALHGAGYSAAIARSIRDRRPARSGDRIGALAPLHARNEKAALG